METDEQIAARVQREKAVQIAWRQFRHATKTHRERKILDNLPSANIAPKSIIVTRGRAPDGSGGSQPIFKNRKHRRKHQRTRGG